MTMHNSSHLQRTAKGLRLKVFDSLLTPAFPTLAHPTFNPFVFYRFQENRGEGPAHTICSEAKSGQGKPSPYKSTGMERPKPLALLHQTLVPWPLHSN